MIPGPTGCDRAIRLLDLGTWIGGGLRATARTVLEEARA